MLAHMTKCVNMIDAFKQGGDFHSRTAVSMYPQLQQEIAEGKLLLEWNKKQGTAPAPLLKEKYSAMRKKAKTMNFSIAYGKSAHGFAKDWECSIEEAKDALDAWFKERKEVKQWQEQVKKMAMEKGWTQTLMGRYRNLTKYLRKGASASLIQHGLRAAINTPIQGGAADIVIAAMVKVYQDKLLKSLGWKTILQIHDELILVRASSRLRGRLCGRLRGRLHHQIELRAGDEEGRGSQNFDFKNYKQNKQNIAQHFSAQHKPLLLLNTCAGTYLVMRSLLNQLNTIGGPARIS